MNKRSKYPSHALKIIDNWDGEGDKHVVFAYKEEGIFYSYDTDEPILQYVGDKILSAWELSEAKQEESRPFNINKIANDVEKLSVIILKDEIEKLRRENEMLAQKLEESDRWIDCLMSAGLDNWDGYDEACEMFNED